MNSETWDEILLETGVFKMGIRARGLCGGEEFQQGEDEREP